MKSPPHAGTCINASSSKGRGVSGSIYVFEKEAESH